MSLKQIEDYYEGNQLTFTEEIKRLAGDEIGYVFGAHKAAELILKEMEKFKEELEFFNNGTLHGIELTITKIKSYIGELEK